MTTLVRAVDNTGAAWPVTGHRCELCGMPLDSAAGATHPGCDPGQPTSTSREAAALALPARVLGAVEIEEATP